MVVLFFCLLSSRALAQLVLITPENAGRSGWTVQVEGEKEDIFFTVSNAQWDTNSLGKVDATLSVQKEYTDLSTTTLGLVPDKGRLCFKFTLARDLVKDSTLAIPAKPTRAATYRVQLGAFLSAHLERKDPQPRPEPYR